MDLSAGMDDRSPPFRKTTIALTVLTTVAVGLRVWSRSLSRAGGRFWWDDYLALCAWACCMCNCGFAFFGVRNGIGRHIATLEPDKIIRITKILYVSQIVFDVGITFAKASALLLYCRIFGWHQKRFRIAVSVTAALVAVYIIYKLPEQIWICIPIQKYWYRETPGHCENDYTNFAMLLTGLVLDVLTDLFILILPMPIITGLKLKASKKIFLITALFCGYITWILSIGRMAAFIAIHRDLDAPDFTWVQIPELSWSLGEISTSVISICVPSWLYLGKRFYHGGISSLFHSRLLPNEGMRTDPSPTMSNSVLRKAWSASLRRITSSVRTSSSSKGTQNEMTPSNPSTTSGKNEISSVSEDKESLTAHYEINIRTETSIEQVQAGNANRTWH